MGSKYFLYSGQGSQYMNMGKKLYMEDETFSKYMRYLDDIVIDETGDSVIEYMYNEPLMTDKIFDNIIFTHPAICMVEYSMTKTLNKRRIIPDGLIGCSLGEYTAMAVAGVVDIEELMLMIIKQARLLSQSNISGGMLAIIDDFSRYQKSYFERIGLQIISVNHNSHFIVSGDRNSIDKLIDDLKGKNINSFDLPVKYGFHSSNIEPFYDVFMNEVADITLKKAKIPVYSCSQCRPVSEYTKDMLWNVVRNNILYREVLQKYVKENDVLIDVGPQGTLAGFSKKILNRTSGIFSTMTLFNQEQKAISQIEDYVNNNKAN